MPERGVTSGKGGATWDCMATCHTMATPSQSTAARARRRQRAASRVARQAQSPTPGEHAHNCMATARPVGQQQSTRPSGSQPHTHEHAVCSMATARPVGQRQSTRPSGPHTTLHEHEHGSMTLLRGQLDARDAALSGAKREGVSAWDCMATCHAIASPSRYELAFLERQVDDEAKLRVDDGAGLFEDLPTRLSTARKRLAEARAAMYEATAPSASEMEASNEGTSMALRLSLYGGCPHEVGEDRCAASMHARPAAPPVHANSSTVVSLRVDGSAIIGVAPTRLRSYAPGLAPIDSKPTLALPARVSTVRLSTDTPPTPSRSTRQQASPTGAAADESVAMAPRRAREGNADAAASGEAGRTRSRPSQVRCGNPKSGSMSMHHAGRPIQRDWSTQQARLSQAGRPIHAASLHSPREQLHALTYDRRTRTQVPRREVTSYAPRRVPARGSAFRARFGPALERCERELLAVPPVHPRSTKPADTPPLHMPSWLRSPEAEAEYATFQWPLTTVDEVRRLLRCEHIAPTWLLLGEFTRAQAKQLEERRGVVALTVDRRAPLSAGLAYQGEFHDVVPLAFWEVVIAWPSCTHQAVADELCCDAKSLDGRMFWGIVAFIYCYAAAHAQAVVVEQPRVWIPVFYAVPYHRVEPAFYGDAVTKTINLHARGVDLPPRLTARSGDWTRKRLRDFEDGDDADRWRSSWSHYPHMTAALAQGLLLHGSCEPLVFAQEVQRFAEAWHDAGLPVPHDYLNPDGRPTAEQERAYQRGKGDGRRVEGVDPRATPSRVVATAHSSFAGAPDGRLGPRHLTELKALSASSVVLMLVSTLLQPLVLASLDGMRVLGAELPAHLARTGAPLKIAQSWAATLGGTVVATTTFLVGRYADGPRVAVTPLEYCPPRWSIVRTPEQRARRHRSGVLMAWCTLTALAGTIVADPVARAFAHVGSFVRPVDQLADAADLIGGGGMPTFTFGAMSAASMVRAPILQAGISPPGWLVMRKEVHEAKLIVDALLECEGRHSEYMAEWANLVKPPDLADIPPELLDALPSFEDEYISTYPFTRAYVPPVTSWLPRRPPQPERPGRCPTSAADLLLDRCKGRIERWLTSCFEHLKCTERGDDDCQPLRPHPLVVGQACLHGWARGIIWDFTFERSKCGVPLDVTLPIESHLDLDYLARELKDYPDQRLVSFLVEGVRFEADVELQTVLIPHLLSLAKGFGSVRKELLRMEALGWYKFFGDFPFWPMYFNGQGSTPRKYEDRWRRTTEGGGPRKETFDEEKLRAWSLNEAARAYHTPRYYSSDPRLAAWAEAVKLLRPRTESGAEAPKWCKECKPTPADVMRDLAILRAAASLLGEPVYLFGDDAKDYFSQLAMAPESWWHLGIVFLSPQQLEERAYSNSFQPEAGKIFFVSERRLGFGVMPSSNIAQRFSEALLHLFRKHMDREEAAIAARDSRPAYAEWQRRRNAVPRADGVDPAYGVDPEQRLYFCHYYTDDPIIGVVGVERALAAIRSWRHVTSSVGLIMAIVEKRNIGTWALWLGILFFAGLGLVVVPKAKLLRAEASLREALTGKMEFGDYRALMGLLEHLRCVNRAGRSTMFSLYEPHSAGGVSSLGPSARVPLTPFMASQLTRWRKLVVSSGGASVLAALDRRYGVQPTGAIYTASADAATDSVTPGLGGYCHGMYWYMPMHPEWLRWLHITVLELLATGINAIVFAPYFEEAARVLLLSDALATPYALTRQSEHSPMMMVAHHALMADPQFQATAQRADCGHLSGDSNAFSDAVSRAEWRRFFDLCRSTGVRTQQLAVPERARRLVQRVVDAARERGVRINPSRGRRDPLIPAALLGLDTAPACSAHDGPRTKATRRQWEVDDWIYRVRSGSSLNPRVHLPSVQRTINGRRRARRGGRSSASRSTHDVTTSSARSATVAVATVRPGIAQLHEQQASMWRAKLASARELHHWSYTDTNQLRGKLRDRQRWVTTSDVEWADWYSGVALTYTGSVYKLVRPSPHTTLCVACNRPLSAIERSLDVCPSCTDHDGPSGGGAPAEALSEFAARLQGVGGKRALPTPAAEHNTSLQQTPRFGEFAQRLQGTQSKAAAAITTTEIGGLRLPVRPPSSSAAAASSMTDTRLRAAAREHAARRATAMAASPFAPALNVDALRKLLQHADDIAEYGSAQGTRRKDDLAWRHWETFAEALGFDPLISSSQARDYPDDVASLLATFMLHVYPKMKGKHGREWAKPRGAFAYVLAIIRIFRRWKVILPPAKSVKAELNGLLRAFVVVYGKEALQPNRQEPLLFSMLEKLNKIREGVTLRGGFTFSTSKAICRAFVRMLNVGWRTGHRLAEFVYHPSGEIYYLTRADVTWIIGGVTVTDPTTAQLAQLRPGDRVLISPPRSKTDQFGEIHSPFPSVVLFDFTRACNAGVCLRDIELEQPCRGAERATTPLFADDAGHPFRHERMDDLLNAALLHVFGAGVMNTHSWHSLRSGLACALKAANCPPDEIQLICRWLNPASLRAYARLGTSTFVTWVDAAEKAVGDSVQTSNLPKYNLCEGFAAMHLEFGRPLGVRAQAIIDAADDANATAAEQPPPAAPQADTRPLTLDNCLQRRVLVPRTCWPAYPCDEHGGRGWTGRIVDVVRRGHAVRVEFVHAVDQRGLQYEDTQLVLAVLEPI